MSVITLVFWGFYAAVGLVIFGLVIWWALRDGIDTAGKGVRLPTDLTTISDDRLQYLLAASERDLRGELARVLKIDARFRRILQDALTVEDEMERRANLPKEGK